MAILLFFLFTSYVKASEKPCEIVRVIDGDTIEIKNDIAPEGLKLSIRLEGIDTPEKAPKAKCRTEAEAGERATLFTKAAIKDAQARGALVICEYKKWDKFGGRILGDIKIDGNRLTDQLLEAGLARGYHGEKKKSWCELTRH